MIRQEWISIDELDCADEVRALRQEFESDPAVVNLEFDVVGGRMKIDFDSPALGEEDIIRRIGGLGMRARMQADRDDRQAERGAPDTVRDWRTILTAGGIGFVLVGFLAHWFQTGSLVAALGHVEAAGSASVPLVPTICYAAAILAGGVLVGPKAWSALKRRRADMNVLMCIAVVGAVAIGQWLEGAVVSVLFSLSLLLEHWSMGRARRAIGELLKSDVRTARCKSPEGDEVRELPVEQVEVGQVVVVRPGEQIPLDGTVVAGSSDVDQSPITGESMPVVRSVDSPVYAGTINGEGPLEIQVTRRSGDTTLARMIRLVEQAQTRRADFEQWIERFAGYYTPAMIALALLVCVVPPLLFAQPWSEWFYNALVLLVIACPCALVISTPVTVVSALTCAARHGVLIKGGRYLEAAAKLRCVAVDKTGTMTRGKPEVESVNPRNGHSREELLQRAVSLETHSTHPIARAVQRCARHENVEALEVGDYRVLNGRGAEASIGGRNYWIGSRLLLRQRKPEHLAEYVGEIDRLENEGRSVVVVGSDKHVCGLITVSDTIRDEAAAAVRELKRLGIESVVLITGDNDATARCVAREVGADRHVSEALPEDKLSEMERLMQRYRHVAMVGDGVNDAPAMAAATIGLAMGAVGTDTAIETADVALMSDDLSRIPWLIRHARFARRVIVQNVTFALGLKALFVLLTLAGVASLWLAIAADTGASLLVVFNGMRLLRSR